MQEEHHGTSAAIEFAVTGLGVRLIEREIMVLDIRTLSFTQGAVSKYYTLKFLVYITVSRSSPVCCSPETYCISIQEILVLFFIFLLAYQSCLSCTKSAVKFTSQDLPAR